MYVFCVFRTINGHFFYIVIFRMGTYLGLCEARIDSLYTIQTSLASRNSKFYLYLQCIFNVNKNGTSCFLSDTQKLAHSKGIITLFFLAPLVRFQKGYASLHFPFRRISKTTSQGD
jgi:hypothetical protein